MKTYAYAVFGAVVILAGLVLLIVLSSGDGGDLTRSSDGGNGGLSSDDGSRNGRSDDLPPYVPYPRPTPRTTENSSTRGASKTADGSGVDPVETPKLEPLLLPGGASVLGIVVEGFDRAPIPGVVITLRAGRAQEFAETDAQGECQFPELAAGFYSYLVEAPDRPMLKSASPVELTEEQDKKLVLKLGEFDHSISGRVLDENLMPLEGIEVAALPYLYASNEQLLVRVDQDDTVLSAADGSYEILDLREGDYEVRSAATEEYPSVKIRVRSGSDTADIMLLRLREVTIVGIVRDDEGAAIEGVEVIPLGQSSRSTRSDAEGSFEFELALGSRKVYTLRFLHGDYREQHVKLEEEAIRDVESHEIDVEMLPRVGLTLVEGRITDDHGDPVSGEVIHLHSLLLKVQYEGVSDEEGIFALQDVQSAFDYRLWIRPRGMYQDYTEKGVHVPAEGLNKEIQLIALGSARLRGKMIDSNGQPIPHFSLWMRSMKAAGRSLQAVGDDRGEFALDDVPEGRLILETKSNPRLTVSGIEVKSGVDLEVELILDWGTHRVDGRIFDEGGQPVAGANVYLSWYHRKSKVRSGSTRKSLSDGDGYFVFTQIGPGEHRLNVNAEGFRSSQKNCKPDAGLELNVILEEIRK